MVDLSKYPPPPPPPPCRSFRNGFFGYHETKESIRAREDYEVLMRGWRLGFESGRSAKAKP